MPKQIHSYEVLRRPIVTEKSTALAATGKYVFEVAPGANKPQIQEAVERAFEVRVSSVNVMNVRGKRKRRGRVLTTGRDWKKAIVTLQAGDQIQLFEGV